MTVENPEQVVKEAFWLAWKACGGPMGLGYLQNNPNATKDAVWENVVNSGDYEHCPNEPNKVSADYVFGRMMKVGFEWDENSITFRDDIPQPDYQGWCKKYPTRKDLVEAAILEVRKDYVQSLEI